MEKMLRNRSCQSPAASHRHRLFFSKVNVIALMTSMIVATTLLIFFNVTDKKNKIVFHGDATKTKNSFEIDLGTPLRMRSGIIAIKTSNAVERIILLRYGPEDKIIPEVKQIGKRHLQFLLTQDVIVSCIQLYQKNSTSHLTVQISRTPLFKPKLLLFQFALLLFFAYFLFAIAQGITRFQRDSGPWTGISRLFLMVIAVFLIYILFNIADYIGLINDWSMPINRIPPLNFLVGFSMIVFFFAGEKLFLLRTLPLAIIFSLLIIVINPGWNLNSCGDATIWNQILWKKTLYIGNTLQYDLNTLSFSEGLSLVFNRAIMKLMSFFLPVVKPILALRICGKIVGIAYLFSLSSFLQHMSDIPDKQKVFFFIVAASFPFNFLLFGYPEFAYYPLPFLVLSLLFSIKYLHSEHRLRYLLYAAFSLTIGGAFHGSAFFSMPIIFLLPFFKKTIGTEKPSGWYRIRSIVYVTITVICTMGVLYFLFKLLGYHVAFDTAKGGIDKAAFISFFPKPILYRNARIFLENLYFFQRGWILLVSFPLLLMVFLFARRVGSLVLKDRLFFLFGITQFIIIMLWGFDYNIKDFDLYIAPAAMISLFYLKKYIEAFNPTKSKSLLFLHLFLFYVVTPQSLLLILTTRH